MGIPHLITFLQPFAARESLSNQHVVIDGPGFAHHIYYICLNSSKGANNAFEASPTYPGLVRAAIAWLNALQDSNVQIEKIYFDGFLPSTKLETRLSRLTNSTTRLSQYHAEHSVPCKAKIEPSASGASVLFGNTAVRASLGKLPPLPFLVPTIIEALAESKFADLVEVSPGEADPYCARYVQQHGGIILTGDSDLLVHDAGESGAVSFFKDILSDETVGLTSLVYRQASITERLALPSSKGLQYLAFEMHMDPHGTFPKLVAQAKLKSSYLDYPKLFAEFIQEYTLLLEPEQSRALSNESPEVFRIMRKELDPRISEYVLQFVSLARIAGQSPPGQAAREVHVFLPFILDSPVRTNSWETSAATRQLGYALINLIVPGVEHRYSVFEHRRRQNKPKGLELQLPSIINIPSECTSLVNTLVHIKAKLKDISFPDYWLAVAVYREVEWAYLYVKPSLTEIVSQQVMEKKKDSNQHLTWESIHFLGQIQASLYSLRLVKQLTSLVVAHLGAAVPMEILSLQDELANLPELSTLPSYGDVVSLVTKIHDLGILRCSKELLGMPLGETTNTETKGKKGKRKREKSASTAAPERKKSSNPFDLLEVE